MIIVVKIDVPTSTSHIVDIIEGENQLDEIRGYEALLSDSMKLDRDHYSIKNISKTRTEVYRKTLMGSYLEYVYTIHTSKEEIEEATEEND
jgi:hypothetical protein